MYPLRSNLSPLGSCLVNDEGRGNEFAVKVAYGLQRARGSKTWSGEGVFALANTPRDGTRC